ncbi:MAG: hypothetical protein V1891_03450 [bacterium]
MKNIIFSKNAFSIIEILIALTFLSVGIFTIAKMFPFGMQISHYSEEQTLASTFAQDKMEELISCGYEGIATGTIEEKHETQSGSFGDKYNFFRETNVVYVDGNISASESDTGMKKIEITIFWNTNDGSEKNITLRRLISRR